MDVLRTALAMGADRAIHVAVPADPDSDSAELEPLAVAKLLGAVARAEGCNLVVVGKQAIDGDNGQTGQMVAGLLGWGQATQASGIAVGGDGGVRVEREVDGGVETVQGRLPMVVTTDLRLNEPRYASLGNIMKAKRKVVERKGLEDYGVDGTRRLRTLRVVGEFFFAVLFFFLQMVLCMLCVFMCTGKLGRQGLEVETETWIIFSKKFMLICGFIEPPSRQGGGKVEDVDGMISKLKELGAI